MNYKQAIIYTRKVMDGSAIESEGGVRQVINAMMNELLKEEELYCTEDLREFLYDNNVDFVEEFADANDMWFVDYGGSGETYSRSSIEYGLFIFSEDEEEYLRDEGKYYFYI